MPSNVVKNKSQEKKWDQAKSIVEKEYKGIDRKSKRYYKLVMSIYLNMIHKDD